MLTKVLISCTLLVAAQAGYATNNYGSQKSVIAGYAAQQQPAVVLTVLPSSSYGAGPSYGLGSNGYNAPQQSYGAPQGYGVAQGPISIPYYSASPRASYNAGVDAQALQLASLVFGLPDAGLPNAATINVPQYSTTSYSAPAVAVAPGSSYGNRVSGASAAAAAANVAAQLVPQAHSSGAYGPAPAKAAY